MQNLWKSNVFIPQEYHTYGNHKRNCIENLNNLKKKTFKPCNFLLLFNMNNKKFSCIKNNEIKEAFTLFIIKNAYKSIYKCNSFT